MPRMMINRIIVLPDFPFSHNADKTVKVSIVISMSIEMEMELIKIALHIA